MVLAILILLPLTLPAAGLPWDDLPDGNGRQETYALCSPCHSFDLVAQQGMSRDSWNETLHWMTEKQGMGELPPTLRDTVLDYLAQAFPENQLPTTSRHRIGATLESLPDHEGRNETFAICSACHSMRLVAQQGLDRDSWDETLEWMAEEQGMAELPATLRNQILDYLVWAFPAERSNSLP